MPVTKFHSVMLRPDSVKRVRPPTTTILNTRPEMRNKWLDTDGEVSMGSAEEEEEEDDEVDDSENVDWNLRNELGILNLRRVLDAGLLNGAVHLLCNVW